MSCCETQNLAVGYGAPLLRDIALRAERGKILALIGPNGAGKSTLLKTLAGQLAAQGGAVLLDGQDLTAYTPNARARKLALMLPHTARTELTSCFEVAAAGRYPYTGRLGILSDADRQQVHDALCLVRAEELEDRDFARISDGQRQRVLLARAVCQQPEILLLDEPTSFLDVKGKAELMDILQVLAHEKNVAVIVTLHELELAQRLADAVVCVAPSGVSAVLAPQDAFAQDNICALFGLTTDQYAVLFAGSGAKPKPQFEHYIRSGQRLLRCGYTTGTCAALGAAALNAEYTLPGVSQTVIITRMEGRTPVPEGERLAALAAHGATMVIFLSIGLIDRVQDALLQGAYTAATPAAVVYKATWPEQKIVHCTVGTLAESTRAAGITKTALIVVGDFLAAQYDRSKLYDPAFTTEFRRGTDR